MNLVCLRRVSQLRQRLSQQAKQEPKFRFYALYDRIYRRDVLQAGWSRVKANKGAAGVDGVEIDDIAASPELEREFLDELERELKEHRYYPLAVRRVYIPKADGKLRGLGIHRVVQLGRDTRASNCAKVSKASLKSGWD